MLGPLVFSSVVSTLTVHQLLGARPTYEIPSFHVVSYLEYPLYILLGLLAGIVSPVFLAFLKGGETLFTRWNSPSYVRLMMGGLVVGIVSVLQPEVWGNGYSVVDSILSENWLWTALLMVFLCKLLATAATVGSGAVGGVFTPTLFFGAVLGCLFGKASHFLFPHYTTFAGGYALVGMGCFLAATTQAPLMAILMIFEMTLQYDVVLPLMLGCVSAHYMSKELGQESIYARHLQQKKAEADAAAPITHGTMQVLDLMKTDPPCIAPNATFGKIANLFTTHRINYVYVVDDQRRFLGVVSLHEMKPYLNDPFMSEAVIAFDMMRDDFPVLTLNQDLTEALRAFTKHDGERIPVVNNDHDRQLVGVISKTDLLLSLAQASAS
jgi:CIC family chloride channel protein